MSSPSDEDPNAELGPLDPRDYSRRTLLANERTYLAWMRTGLTVLTVALAAARVVPELADDPGTPRWPYLVLGSLFAVLGLTCLVYGERRRRAVDGAVRRGEFVDADGRVTLVLTGLAVVLGLGTLAIIWFT